LFTPENPYFLDDFGGPAIILLEMTKLSVNLNKIALLRNQRNIDIPSVIESARTVIVAGSAGVTVHPRPDERHIRYSDAYELAELLKGYPGIEYNIEGNPFTGKFMELLCEIKPDQATLVPDDPNQNTSDHGWDIPANAEKLKAVVNELKSFGIRVSVFMDASPDVVKAVEVGADRVELYTEPYATAVREAHNETEVTCHYTAAAKAAVNAGLGVNAGHDLSLDNLEHFIKSVPGVLEVSIGHALIAEALQMGIDTTVKKYVEILNKS